MGASSAVGFLVDSLSHIQGSRVRASGRSHSFMECDHDIISIFSLPLIQSRAVVSYWRKYMYVPPF